MINKDERLEMAQKHAICTSSQHKEFMHDGLFAFVDDILERAAVECDRKNIIFKKASDTLGVDEDFEGAAAGARSCAKVIRSLKTQGE